MGRVKLVLKNIILRDRELSIVMVSSTMDDKRIIHQAN